MSTEFRFFDAHTHPQFAAYAEDREEVVRRAIEAGVHMVAVGTQKETSRAALELAEKHPGYIWAAVGLHPIHTSKSHHDAEELGGGEAAKAFTSRGEEFDYEYYKKLANDPKVVAIGECGLDYYRLRPQTDADGTQTDADKSIKRKQIDAFEAQIRLARDVKKPLMIHCRAAFPELIDVLVACLPRSEAARGRMSLVMPHLGVIHFFSGTADEAKKLLALGFYFTFGGVITFTRDYDEIIKMIPLDRILSETDAPYVAPVPYRGKLNEPAYVVEVVKKLAELKNISAEEMAERILGNAREVFNINLTA